MSHIYQLESTDRIHGDEDCLQLLDFLDGCKLNLSQAHSARYPISRAHIAATTGKSVEFSPGDLAMIHAHHMIPSLQQVF